MNEVNKFGMTALHHGAVSGSSDVVRILVKNGGNANQVMACPMDKLLQYNLH